jgi:uncharacterized membrane protein required for colicin V production
MAVDIFCLAFVFIFLVLGLFSGFLAQVVRILALVGAFVLAHPASSCTRPLLTRWMDVATLMGDLLSLFLAWVAGYIAILLIGKVLVRIIKGSSGSIDFLDRILGGLLGAAKGFLIVYLMACVLVLLRAPLDKLIPDKYPDLKKSRLAAFAEQHNVLSMIVLPDFETFTELTLAFRDRGKLNALGGDPVMEDLRKNEAFQRLMKDKDFQKALEHKQLGAILNNKNFREAIRDPQVIRLLATVDRKRSP